MIDLALLFRPVALPRSRFAGGLDVEIEGVRSGTKPIAAFSFPEAALTDDPMYRELRSKSLNAGLLLIHQSSEEAFPEICVFICRAEQVWRAHALMAVRHCLTSSGQPWSYNSEYLESYLLGYSKSEIDEWFERKREMRVSPEGVTLYLLMSAPQAAALDDLGMKALSVETLVQPMLAFYMSGFVTISHVATSLIGDRVLGRVAVKAFALQRIFGPTFNQRRGELHSCAISAGEAKHLNHSFQSRIELWANGQWQ